MTIKKNEGANPPARAVSFIKISKGDVLEERYEVVREIGKGGFSSVFEVIDLKVNESRAIKVFGFIEDLKTEIDEIGKEVKLLKRLDHINIVRIYDFYKTEYVFYVMDLINGQSLKEAIKAKRIKKHHKTDYSIQIAEGIQEAHENFISHNDLKPENVIIDKSNKPIIIDFGTGRIKGSIDKSGEESYTPEYYPPYNPDEKTNDTLTDVFSYGVCLYELYYYKYPFETDKDRNPDYKIPSHILKSRRDIDKIIKKCIQPFAEDRYQNFNEIIADLKQVNHKKESIFSRIPKKVISYIPKIVNNPDIKSDLKKLSSILLLLLILLPFYILSQNKFVEEEQNVLLDTPSYSVYQNNIYKGITPVNLNLRKGDQLSFSDEKGKAVFDYTYNGEKKFYLDFKGNKVYLNKKQIGQIIKSRRDLPLKRNLAFIRFDKRISGIDFKKQKHPRLNLVLSHDFSNSDLSFLPHNMSFLNLQGNKRINNLALLRQFSNLKGINAENTKLEARQFENLPNLELLNINNTGNKSLLPLKKLKKLKHISVRRNGIRNLEGITKKGIESISIDADSLNKPEQIKDLSKIRDYDIKSNSDSLKASVTPYLKQKSEENKVIMRKVIDEKKQYFRYIFYGLLFLVSLLMSWAIILLIRIFFKKIPGLQEIKEEKIKPEQDIVDSVKKEQKTYNKTDIQKIETAIKDKRYYYPPMENALYHIFNLLKDNPDDQILLKYKNHLSEIISEKVELHKERNEFEPIYLATSAIKEFFPSKENNDLFKKSSKSLIKNSKFKMVKVKAGSYEMGDFSSPNQTNGNNLHKVSLSPFLISQTVVTNNQFCEFLNEVGNKSEYGSHWFKEDSQYAQIVKLNGQYYPKIPYGDFPVYEVNWFGAKAYCEWKGGRLPSEAEWEYCARSKGQEFIYATGNEVDKTSANYLIDINDTLWHSVYPVKSFKPNRLKLYEMSGNILEWCEDWYDKYYYNYGQENDPLGPDSGEMKVVRGGAWCFGKEHLKTYYRGSAKPLTRNNFIGFRVVIPKR